MVDPRRPHDQPSREACLVERPPQRSAEDAGTRDITTGRLDTRYQGPDYNRLSEEADYDPQSNAISAAYTTAINHYLRSELKYGDTQTYKPTIYQEGNPPAFRWDLRHQAPGGPPAWVSFGGTNVMPDLATPFFQGIYEMRHLPIPQELQANIRYHDYEAGHMVYVNEGILRLFHDDVATFIHETSGVK